jgi:hypothetical protein
LAYHCRSLLFLSQKHIADHKGDEHTEWFVDVYPKGVWFQRCLTVYRPPGLEVRFADEITNIAHRHETYVEAEPGTHCDQVVRN